MNPPKMKVDEVLFLVDTYFKILDTRKIRVDNELIYELSNNMRALPVHDESAKSDVFRNFNGMKIKLYEVASLDPETKHSIKSSSKLQKYVFEYYKNRSELLNKIVKAIINCLPLPFDYNKYDEDNLFIGGNILLQYHKHIENKTNVANLVKVEAEKRYLSKCQICNIDLNDIYGEKGYQLLEHHYGIALYNYYKNIEVLSSKFVRICPNCHKLAHSDIDLFEEERLKDYVKGRGVMNV